VYPTGDGLGSLSVTNLPLPVLRAVEDALRQYADAARAPGDQRTRQQRMVDRLVMDGVESGDFRCPNPADAGRAVTTMCVGVSTWYRPQGRLGPDELVARYLLIARRMVGYFPDQP